MTSSDHGLVEELAIARRERDQAIAHARALEHELGTVRGQVKRLELMMWRRTARRERLAAQLRRVLGALRRTGPSA